MNPCYFCAIERESLAPDESYEIEENSIEGG